MSKENGACHPQPDMYPLILEELQKGTMAALVRFNVVPQKFSPQGRRQPPPDGRFKNVTIIAVGEDGDSIADSLHVNAPSHYAKIARGQWKVNGYYSPTAEVTNANGTREWVMLVGKIESDLLRENFHMPHVLQALSREIQEREERARKAAEENNQVSTKLTSS